MKKILIVAMADSVHTARWLRQFDEDNIEFVLFPSTPHRRIHNLINTHSQEHTNSTVRISRFMKRGALPLGLLDLVFSNFFRAKLLNREIKSFKPDIIHIMETQHAGYLTDRALRNLPKRPKTVLSIWGSDLFWFQSFKKHNNQIASLLKLVNVLVTECRRDEELARKFGFSGDCLYGIPASGGFDYKDFSGFLTDNPPSKRKTIAIKGYSGFVGLGPMAVKAMQQISDVARGYEVVVYSASLYTKFLAKRIKSHTGLNIKVQLKHSLTPSQMQSLFLRSRIVVGVSKSDGLPATIKEAMFTGAFPVQTDTSCANEWLKDGISILLIPVGSALALETALRKALGDDKLVDGAASVNFEIAKTRMDSVVVRNQILSLYSPPRLKV